MMNTVSKGAFSSKSSTTIRENHIFNEAQHSRQGMIKYLRTQYGLTLTFDGQTTRKPEPIYSLHVTTPDRQIFMPSADVSFEPHTAEYVCRIASTLIEEIGPERFIAVCSDNTGNTRKGRRLICSKYPNILDLADPCHKMHNWVKDIVALPHFRKVKALIAVFYISMY